MDWKCHELGFLAGQRIDESIRGGIIASWDQDIVRERAGCESEEGLASVSVPLRFAVCARERLQKQLRLDVCGVGTACSKRDLAGAADGRQGDRIAREARRRGRCWNRSRWIDQEELRCERGERVDRGRVIALPRYRIVFGNRLRVVRPRRVLRRGEVLKRSRRDAQRVPNGLLRGGVRVSPFDSGLDDDAVSAFAKNGRSRLASNVFEQYT